MYIPNAASGYEWNRMATLSIRFYSLHLWVHCVLYKFVIFEIFVVEKSIRTFSPIIIIGTNFWKFLEIIVRENKPLAAKRRDIIV